MTLNEARMCLDCETLRNYRVPGCPVCASEASVFLAEWIPSVRQLAGSTWIMPKARNNRNVNQDAVSKGR